MKTLPTLAALWVILATEVLCSAQPVDGGLAALMVAGIDKYLQRELVASVEQRKPLWKPASSPDAQAHAIKSHRERLARILGVVDRRLPVHDLELVATTATPALIADGERYRIFAVRWPVFDGVDAEGLLLEPRGKPLTCIVALPDADWTPEMLAGISPGVPPAGQFARRLVENGCRVLIPTLINRQDTWSGNPSIRMTNQPHREFIYRMAYEMGRHIIGYEVQKVLAAVDWLARGPEHPPVGLIGYGEGGLLALYSAALDPRIKVTVVSGYFAPRERLWEEPIYRNVWSLLREFGDAELALLVTPSTLIIEPSRQPSLAGPPPVRQGRSGAAPGKIDNPSTEAVIREFDRARAYFAALKLRDSHLQLIAGSTGTPGSDETLRALLEHLGLREALVASGQPLQDARGAYDPDPRQHRQFDQLINFTQKLVHEARFRRDEFFWSRVDTSSPERWQQTTRPFRAYFWEEVIGKLPPPTLPTRPCKKLLYDEPKWQGYQIVLDLYPDVFASGILLVPKDLKPGERRPVVVCQHGLEGRAEDAVNPKVRTPYYHSFGAQLADRGYIVYAPQNPYIGGDKFRVLQRMANPLKLSLFAFIVRQHERTLDWLASLPMVDGRRIGFYGLSYGGKTAVRVPAIVERYALSICSGDFNEWIWKNVTVDFGGSYALVGEYEMFEFDLGNTFNYAEMAALIAPRPFMVERGHNDGVSIDEYVAFEYAKVRRLYAKLDQPNRTEIEFFNSGHEINGKGTFAFLHKHLHWPK
jgi:dienelactone hydrolase